MSTDVATSRHARGRQFSLRQGLIAIIGLAIGLAIWRSPRGDWIDIPITTLSYFFVISLTRHAAAQRRMLIEAAAVNVEQRFAARLKLWGLIGLALTLAVACAIRFFAVNQILLTASDESDFYLVIYPQLPQDLAMLTMLAALGIGGSAKALRPTRSRRQTVYSALAAIGLLLILVLYWADRMLVAELVYFAVNGITLAQSARLVPPEMNVSTALREHRFVLASGIGLVFLAANLMLIVTLRKWWNTRVLKWVLLALVTLGITAQCLAVGWLAVRGIHQLAPEFEGTFVVPPSDVAIIVGIALVIAISTATWKTVAKPDIAVQGSPFDRRKRYFHESWQAAALLGTCAASLFIRMLIDVIIEAVQGSFGYTSMGWQLIPDAFTWFPVYFIWWAAVIGGLSAGWVRWRNRAKPFVDAMPEINPAQFSLVFFALLIVTLTAAPIIAAASFSYGLMRYPKLF